MVMIWVRSINLLFSWFGSFCFTFGLSSLRAASSSFLKSGRRGYEEMDIAVGVRLMDWMDWMDG